MLTIRGRWDLDEQCKLAHDLNNAFAIISGHIDFLTDYSQNDPAMAGHINAIREALWRAAKLVHDCQCNMAHDRYVKQEPSARVRAYSQPLELDPSR